MLTILSGKFMLQKNNIVPTMNSRKTNLYILLIIISFIGALLAGVVALRYSYTSFTLIESGIGLLILVVIGMSLWLYNSRFSKPENLLMKNGIIIFGIALGVLWTIEISINNFIAPPLPARDIIDNIFWAVIAFSILIFSSVHAFRKDSLVTGIKVGIWNGFISSLFACCMALTVIVFGMHFILSDPLNVTEWAARASNSNAPSMAAYFAFETFAGAFGHLIVLGFIMGGLLGVLGGCIGKSIKHIFKLK